MPTIRATVSLLRRAVDRRDGAAAKVVDRLFVKQAGTKPHPQHDAVINAFQALRK